MKLSDKICIPILAEVKYVKVYSLITGLYEPKLLEKYISYSKCRTPLKLKAVSGKCVHGKCAYGISSSRCHSLRNYTKYRIDKLMLICEVKSINIYTGDIKGI